MTLTVINMSGDSSSWDTVSVSTMLNVAPPAEIVTCTDRAACNFGAPPPCHYPGQQGSCENPSNGVAYVNQQLPQGGCECVGRPGTLVWFENFDVGGVMDLNGSEPLAPGYGYDGATETNDVGPTNGQWWLDMDAALLDLSLIHI